MSEQSGEQFGTDFTELAAPVDQVASDILPGEAHLEPADVDLETYLIENAAVFARVDEAWKTVRIEQQKVYKGISAYFNGQRGTALSHAAAVNKTTKALGGKLPPGFTDSTRGVDRSFDRLIQSRLSLALGTCRRDAHEFYTDNVVPELESLDDEDLSALCGLYSEWSSTIYSRKAAKLDSKTTPITPKFTPKMEAHKDNADTLGEAYIKAFFAQDTAIKSLVGYLEGNPERIAQFLPRIEEMADYARFGLHEFPGLLEVLATHDLDSEGAFISKLADAMPIDFTAMRLEFIQDCFAPEMRTNKVARSRELISILTGMHFVGRSLAGDKADFESVISQLADRTDIWPIELSQVFNGRITAQTQNTLNRFKSALQPYVRKGRLAPPATTNDSALERTTNPTRKTRIIKIGSNHHAGVKALDTAEDIGVEQESEPILSFAVLSRANGHKQAAHYMVGVENIDELLQQRVFDDFLDGHSHSPEVVGALRHYVGMLAGDPHNAVNTRRMRGNENGYDLSTGDEENIRSRRLRTFSPRQVPGLKTPKSLSNLRIFYDVVTVDSTAHLVFHSVSLDKS